MGLEGLRELTKEKWDKNVRGEEGLYKIVGGITFMHGVMNHPL